MGAATSREAISSGRANEIHKKIEKYLEEAGTEYEEDSLEAERNERIAKACFKLQPSAKEGHVDTGDNLKMMMTMMAIPPADDEEFRSWKHRYLENPNAETIDVNDFVDFSSKVRASFRMTTHGALLALSHITQTSYSSGASRSPGRSPGRRRVGGEIQPEVLLQEINTNLVTNPIDLQQVLDVVREIDRTGRDVITKEDFFLMMGAPLDTD